MLSQASVQHARWSVMWLGKKGYMIEKVYGDDFHSALDAYGTLRDAGKRWCTLRSMNVGFAPPQRLTAHPTTAYEIVTVRKKRYKKKVTTTTNLLLQLNREGKFWCPYCIQVRTFVKAEDEPHIMCPVCETTTRDFHVRRHNPMALSITYRQNRAPRAPTKTTTKRSRRSTRQR